MIVDSTVLEAVSFFSSRLRRSDRLVARSQFLTVARRGLLYEDIGHTLVLTSIRERNRGRILKSAREGVRVGPVAVEPRTVDEERRRAVHSAAHAAQKVFLHAGLVHAVLQVARDERFIHADDSRVLGEVLVGQRDGGVPLVLEDRVMHRPERHLAAVRRYALGCLGSVQRPGVDLDEWEVAEDEAERTPDIAEASLQHLHEWVSLAAVGALVVPVLNQSHRRVDRTAAVVAVRHVWPETAPRRGCRSRCRAWRRGLCHAHGADSCAGSRGVASSAAIASRASRMPSAPGLTPTGER